MSRPIQSNFNQHFLLPPALTDWISAGDPVWFIKDFVEALDLDALGFSQHKPSLDGRAYYPNDMLLRVWLYGWMERIRSPRRLEKACMRDIGFVFLTCNHHPDHNTLWRFFNNNKKPLKSLFKQVVLVACRAKLIGFVLHALDGTKITAASSRAKAWHQKQLEEQLKQIDAIINEYVLSVESAAESEESGYAMPETMQNALARKQQIAEALSALEQAKTQTLHPNEPDARMMKHNNGAIVLSYNAQIVVDERSDLIVAAEVSNKANDYGQLVPMVEQVVENVGQSAAETVADAGYCSGEQLEAAERKHLPVLVNLHSNSPEGGEFRKENFVYDADKDVYICPLGKELRYQRTKIAGKKKQEISVRSYRCYERECPRKAECSSDPKGRTILRMPHNGAIERQRKKQQEPMKKQALFKRKAIVEHVFGIIKQIDGLRRFTVRGLDGVMAQWALVCTAVNLRKLYAFWAAGALVLRA